MMMIAYVTGGEMNTIKRQMQLCINKINKWAMENGIKFSKTKTVMIIMIGFIHHIHMHS